MIENVFASECVQRGLVLPPVIRVISTTSSADNDDDGIVVVEVGSRRLHCSSFLGFTGHYLLSAYGNVDRGAGRS